MRFIIIIFLFISMLSCSSEQKKSAEETNVDSSDNTQSTVANGTDTSEGHLKVPSIQLQDQYNAQHISDSLHKLKRDTTGDAAQAQRMKNSKIDVDVYRNTTISGYGYDISIDGHKYVHQPNIPAIPGNDGFKTEEKARKTGNFVANKIHNNIMPPTVDVKELDSLGVR